MNDAIDYPVVIRDMDLIRDVLLAIEKDRKLDGTGNYSWTLLGISDKSADDVMYSVRVLIQARYVTGSLTLPTISSLTWDGHEFLDNIKDPGIWAKTKKKAGELQGAGISVISQIALAEVKKHFGLA